MTFGEYHGKSVSEFDTKYRSFEETIVELFQQLLDG